MPILNLKDKDGNWHNIPAIKGDKGDKGEKGDKGDRGEYAQVDQTYNPESENPLSGKGMDDALQKNVGDINAVLGAVIEGSSVLPTAIINKVVEKAAAGVEKKIGGRFITAVAVNDTGSVTLEENAAYFILSDSETGKIKVYDRTTEEIVELTGKAIGIITGNYGDSNPASVLGFVGVYGSAVITKGTYIALDDNKSGSISWEGEATLITVKNVKGEG